MPSKEADGVRDALDGIEMDTVDGGAAGELGEWHVPVDRGPEFERFEEIERSCFSPYLRERWPGVHCCDPYC